LPAGAAQAEAIVAATTNAARIQLPNLKMKVWMTLTGMGLLLK
jgi:hypothetical protein